MLAVIMAGGKGTRLGPYTKVVPKPLLPLGEMPILEIVIKQLKNEGFSDVIVTTGYQGKLIRAYFEDGAKYGLNISYTVEEEALGTVGALSLARDRLDAPFLITNGDILTRSSFKQVLDFHREHEADFTIGVVKLKIDIPYGVVLGEGELFSNIVEKPKFFFNIGAGIYAASPSVFEYISQGEYMDVPTLVKALKDGGARLVSYEITDYWKDIGIHADFEQANRDVKEWSDSDLYHEWDH